jgi:Transposase
MKTSDLCRKHGISEASFYSWKAKYGGLEVSEASRLDLRSGIFGSAGGGGLASPHGSQRQASRPSQGRRARWVCRVVSRKSARPYACTHIGITPS